MTFLGASATINGFKMFWKRDPPARGNMSCEKYNFISTKSVTSRSTVSSPRWTPTASDGFDDNFVLRDLTYVQRSTRRWKVGKGGGRAKWCVAAPSPTPETHCHQERVCSSKLSATASFWGVPLSWRWPADIHRQASAGPLASRQHAVRTAWNIDHARGWGGRSEKKNATFGANSSSFFFVTVEVLIFFSFLCVKCPAWNSLAH